ncbi:MAG: carboxypeptidase regulatory-like domain-containing protein, partial [Alphaproteobacteria bacterium]|nr:carboxypeptidase regulatory-like domain-containing protein [Alphaproteobacteria bacterium]
MPHATHVMRAAAFALLACLLGVHAGYPPARAEMRAPPLSGIVSSTEEGAMEGVLVSARRDGSPITITVVSDAQGRYRFPADRLSAGRYTLTIRAVGYALDAPQAAEVSGAPATRDLHLRKADDLAALLTNTEWLMSMPGTAEQKRPLIECMSCHTLERALRSHYDADAMFGALQRMPQYANNTTMQRVQKRVAERHASEEQLRRSAEYLAGVNLSKGAWPFELKTLPRPQGRATHVIITEYDLPRATIAPHDVRTDAQGFVWYSNFVENDLGRLDPRTGAHVEFAYPEAKPGFPTGSLALELDEDGNFWLATMFQSGLVRFDTKTQTFRHFPVPAALDSDAMQQSLLMPGRAHVDGKVWTNDVARGAILRLDVASGNYQLFDPFVGRRGTQHSPYGLAADAQNNLYFMDFADESIGRVDAKTGRSLIYPTPTPRSRPRRTMMDAQGRIWFAEFAANKVAMFDPAKEAFREWDVPTPHTYPYDVFLDRYGELWSGSMSSDRVLRFDPQT